MRYYLFVVMISLVPASLYGNPQKVHYCISDEVQIYMNVLASLRQMFEAVNDGRDLSEKDFKPLLSEQCSVKSIRHDKNRARILTEFVYSGTVVGLILERNRIGLYQKGSDWSLWVHRKSDKRIALYASSEEKRLMRDACKRHDIFSKHPCNSSDRYIQINVGADPFELRMQDAFEQFGYGLTQSVKYELPFAINAENAYAFLKKWCTDKKQKGESLVAIQNNPDVQSLCGALINGANCLCSRVLDIFKPTVIFVRKKNGVFTWTVRCPKDKEEKYQLLAWQGIKEKRKNVFIVAVDYLSLCFYIKFERNRHHGREIFYNGYDNLSVAYEEDIGNQE